MYRNKAILAGAQAWLAPQSACIDLTHRNTYKLPQTLRQPNLTEKKKLFYLIHIFQFDGRKKTLFPGERRTRQTISNVTSGQAAQI